jgi:hypothetical protein
MVCSDNDGEELDFCPTHRPEHGLDALTLLQSLTESFIQKKCAIYISAKSKIELSCDPGDQPISRAVTRSVLESFMRIGLTVSLQIMDLESTITGIHHILQTLKNNLTPCNRIPAEIICQIFDLVQDTVADSIAEAFKLSRVCQR